MQTVEKSFFQFRIFSSSDERMFTLMFFSCCFFPIFIILLAKWDIQKDPMRWMIHLDDYLFLRKYFIINSFWRCLDTLSRFDHPSSKYILSQTDLYGMSKQDWPIITKQFIYIHTLFIRTENSKAELFCCWVTLLLGKAKLTKQKIKVKVDYLCFMFES